jgi:hypothetical protein
MAAKRKEIERGPGIWRITVAWWEGDYVHFTVDGNILHVVITGLSLESTPNDRSKIRIEGHCDDPALTGGRHNRAHVTIHEYDIRSRTGSLEVTSVL